MMPSQKLGIEMPKKPATEPRLSAQEFGLAPAQTPSGMPTDKRDQHRREASSMVAGSRSPISAMTGSEYLNDMPRSPDGDVGQKAEVLDVDRLIEAPSVPRFGNVGRPRPLPTAAGRPDRPAPHGSAGTPAARSAREPGSSRSSGRADIQASAELKTLVRAGAAALIRRRYGLTTISVPKMRPAGSGLCSMFLLSP